MWLWFYALSLLPLGTEPFTSPASDKPEYGHGLTPELAREGWIALFDGQTNYGWKDGSILMHQLNGGRSTTIFLAGEIRGEVAAGGILKLGNEIRKVGAGSNLDIKITKPGAITLGNDLVIKSLRYKPADLQPAFNGRDMSGLTVLRHPKLAENKQATWKVEDGKLVAVGGPGAVELDGKYGDVIIQVEVRMRAKLVNGGLFFRSIPGDFMNGYEAQLFNGCYESDPAKPARYSTGAIDDRLLARRLVSRDLEPFTMTVIAVGPHIATWVNGYQTVDWTDSRSLHANPREGMRLEPGTIQLQAHDPETNIEFRKVLVGSFKNTP